MLPNCLFLGWHCVLFERTRRPQDRTHTLHAKIGKTDRKFQNQTSNFFKFSCKLMEHADEASFSGMRKSLLQRAVLREALLSRSFQFTCRFYSIRVLLSKDSLLRCTDHVQTLYNRSTDVLFIESPKAVLSRSFLVSGLFAGYLGR